MTASIPVLHCTATLTTRSSAVHILYTVYSLQMALTVIGNGIDSYKWHQPPLTKGIWRLRGRDQG